MDYAENYRNLEVYKLAKQLSHDVFLITKDFPKEEMYSMRDQIKRFSRLVGAQIAEAWAKRKYEKHFVSKPTDADGEQLETQHWIETAIDCNYISKDDASKLISVLSIMSKLYIMLSKNLFTSTSSAHRIYKYKPHKFFDTQASTLNILDNTRLYIQTLIMGYSSIGKMLSSMMIKS